MPAKSKTDCGCVLACPQHTTFPDLVAALDEVNRLGNLGRYSQGSAALLELLNRARGARA